METKHTWAKFENYRLRLKHLVCWWTHFQSKFKKARSSAYLGSLLLRHSKTSVRMLGQQLWRRRRRNSVVQQGYNVDRSPDHTSVRLAFSRAKWSRDWEISHNATHTTVDEGWLPSRPIGFSAIKMAPKPEFVRVTRDILQWHTVSEAKVKPFNEETRTVTRGKNFWQR